MMDFKNKIAIITGASSGIGKALVYELAKRGARIVAGARSIEALQKIRDELLASGAEIIPVKTDVTHPEDCAKLINQSVESFGGIDLMINNAGISMRALFNDLEVDVIKKVMDVNFWGTVYCSKYALPYLLKSKGSLVAVSSIAGYKGLPGRAGYSASKFAIHGLMEVIRIENMKKGLHVLTACPGFTASNIRNTALAADGSAQGESPRNEAKMMSAEEVALHIINAVKTRKNTLTLTSQGKLTVLLNKFFPNYLNKMVYDHFAKETDSPLN
jgi:short-subunit dehydrogenase